jgi:hypothetical protein
MAVAAISKSYGPTGSPRLASSARSVAACWAQAESNGSFCTICSRASVAGPDRAAGLRARPKRSSCSTSTLMQMSLGETLKNRSSTTCELRLAHALTVLVSSKNFIQCVLPLRHSCQHESHQNQAHRPQSTHHPHHPPRLHPCEPTAHPANCPHENVPGTAPQPRAPPHCGCWLWP